MEINIPDRQLAFLLWLLNEVSEKIQFEDEEETDLLNALITTINNRLEIEEIINGEAFFDETTNS